ncbi:MmgE/PrpD family protein [Pseudomonas citronellolis]|uniref:MmgE/PrpD family protein n=1 Tax=Pseudomonas citronellolis TaxID=53408 RepID=UPI000778D3D0|nr:MmgE/PrpD family protein [Pseudomonas citronellolis]AMO76101.1 MmgE/PrpD family protein [Pseudomonas citronellolis]
MQNRDTPTEGMPAVTQSIASFVSAADWADLPDEVRHEAKRALVNYFAVSLAGCNDPDIVTARTLYKQLHADGAASVIGCSERVGMLDAAALNAMSANVFDFDDTHIPTIIHPTAPVAAALLAFAEERKVSGVQFMLALVLGIEIECRLGMAVHPWHYQRGWHITSTCGVLGAAVAVGKLLGLDVHQIIWSLGNASAQASGLVETLGSAAKSLSVGNAPRNGILSALLAQRGFAGPEYPLEGGRGFLHVMGDQPRFDEITRGLGERWSISANTYKPYPCGVVLNPVIEACIALRKDPGWSFKEVSRVELTGHPLLRQRTDRPGIKLGRESQVSAQHAVAVTLATGKAGLGQFSDSAVADPMLRALYPLVVFHDDTEYSVESATVRICLESGCYLEHHVAAAKGGLTIPLSDAELEDKLRTLAVPTGLSRKVDRLLEAIWSLDRCEDVSSLLVLATGD